MFIAMAIAAVVVIVVMVVIIAVIVIVVVVMVVTAIVIAAEVDYDGRLVPTVAVPPVAAPVYLLYQSG